jgi:predicted flap endonuclease-1-like 5' DNA nuclease
MASFKTSLSFNPRAFGQVSEQFWRNWQGTMLDARETLLKTMESRNPVDFWTAQAQLGARNVERWTGFMAAAPECLAPEPAEAKPTAVRTPAAVVIDVEPEVAEPPADAAPSAPASEPVATKPEEQPVAAADILEAETAEATVFEADFQKADLPEAEVPEAEAVEQEAAAHEADNLERIRGIGPAIAAKLNDQGIFTYAQIAGMDDAAVAALDETLNFRGRIDRDDWIAQARQLAGT